MPLFLWIEDHILAFIQRRCEHPGMMVAVDILEGCATDVQVRYCRRCGSIKTEWFPRPISITRAPFDGSWRTPDPTLWRG